jgi:CAAX prenyl protease-like protein
MIRGLVHPASEELDRLLTAAALHTSFGVALVSSVLLVAWGNLVVVLTRKLSSQRDAEAGEILTLCAQFAGGVATLVALALLGWSAADLGVTLPRFEHAEPLPVAVVVLAVVVVVSFGALGFIRSTHVPGRASTRIQLFRLLGGTAFGEEALHRGFSLALWCGTDVGAGGVVAANAVIFALWHLASAYRDRRLHVTEIIAPGIGALFFLWFRLTFGSLLIPWLLHAATNIPLVALARENKGIIGSIRRAMWGLRSWTWG